VSLVQVRLVNCLEALPFEVLCNVSEFSLRTGQIFQVSNQIYEKLFAYISALYLSILLSQVEVKTLLVLITFL
jgi:hypothetical protein